MSSPVMIEAVVREVTVLLAQLATAGGARAPLAQVASQVFLELSRELEAQGVSRRVSADMFGVTLRTYQRKTQRLRESATERGRTLWEAVYAFIRRQELTRKDAVIERFGRDDEADVRGILRDLVESGLVFVSGSSDTELYRIADAVPGAITSGSVAEPSEDLAWAIVFHEGPLTADAVAARMQVDPAAAAELLRRLQSDGRVQVDAQDAARFVARRLVVPLDAETGWEAAVYDHFRAVVRTICAKLAADPAQAAHASKVGGSTYSFDVDEQHPLFDEVMGLLSDFRSRCSALRERVNAHNASAGGPRPRLQVVAYAGQSLSEPEATEDGQR